MLLFTAGRLLFPVDAQVARVAIRLGYGRASEDPGRRDRTVQRTLSRELPADVGSFRRTFLYLSHHGSATCIERHPHCGVCPIIKGCPHGQREIADFRLQISD
jgi:endonuclease-3